MIRLAPAVLAPAVLACALALTGCGLTSKNPPPTATSKGESAMTATQHFTATSFPAAKLQSKPVLVDFWAPWCGPCRTQGPILDQVATQAGALAVVGKVNVDEERELAAQYGVQSIPTLVLLKDGKEVQRFVGVQSAEVLLAAINTAK